MGGWLILTQKGLSPLKKRQASLDALTDELTCYQVFLVLIMEPKPIRDIKTGSQVERGVRKFITRPKHDST